MSRANPDVVAALEAALVRARGLGRPALLARLGRQAAEYGALDLAAQLAKELAPAVVDPASKVRLARVYAALGRAEDVSLLAAELPVHAIGEGIVCDVAQAFETVGHCDAADAWLARAEEPEIRLGRHARIAAGRGAHTRAERLAERMAEFGPRQEDRASLSMEMAAMRPKTDAWAVALKEATWPKVLAFAPDWRLSIALRTCEQMGRMGWKRFAGEAAVVGRASFAAAKPKEARPIDVVRALAFGFGVAGMAEDAAEVVEDYREAFHGYGVPSEHAVMAVLWAVAGDEEEAENYCWSTARFAKQRDQVLDDSQHRELAEARAWIGDVEEALAHAAAIEHRDASFEMHLDLAQIFHQAAAVAGDGDGVADAAG